MDLRLLPLAFGLWASTLISLFLLGLAKPYQIFIWICTIVFISFYLIKRKYLGNWNSVSIVFLIIGVICGPIIAAIRIVPLRTGLIHEAAKQNAVVEVSGVMESELQQIHSVNELNFEISDFGSFKLKVSDLTFRGINYKPQVPITVFCSGENLIDLKQLSPGTKLKLVGRIKSTDIIRGVAANLSLTRKVEVIQGPPKYQLLASYFRNGLHNSLDRQNPEVAGLVPGLALGDVSALPNGLKNDMKAAGLTHLTAVSGSNVTLFIAIILAIGRKLKISNRANFFVALIGLAAFVVVVRPQPSVLRAAAMGVIMLVALMSKSKKSPIPALTGSVILLILVDPWLAISYGFSLSVFATAGLLLWAKNLLNKLDMLLPKRIPEWVVLGLVVTISAQIAVFPILVALNSPISFSSLPANLISVPLAGPTMIFGILAAIFVPIYVPVAHLFAWLSAMPASVIVLTAHFFAHQTWLEIPWPKGAGGVILALLAIVGGVQLNQSWTSLNLNKKQLTVTFFVTAMWVLWQPPGKALFNWVPNDWLVVSCDVGQGDATVIRVTKHEAILVDVGGNPKLINKCLNELKITKITLLLLTHFHADHVAGLPGVFDGRVVLDIRISPLAEPKLTTGYVNQVLTEKQITTKVMTYPEYFKIGKVELFCIWPKSQLSTNNNSPNNSSVSLLVAIDGIKLLLPGDVEPEAQEEIIRLINSLTVDVIKIPHHGSKYQSSIFAQKTNAKIALISVGSENKYGHPAMETIFRCCR